MANLTTGKALQVLESRASAPPSLLQLLQTSLSRGFWKHEHRQKASAKKHTSLAALRGSSSASTSETSTSSLVQAQAALEQINTELTGALNRRDAESTRCSTFEEQMNQHISAVQQDVSFFSAQATAARAEVLRSQQTAQMLSKNLPSLQEGLRDNSRHCAEEVEAHRQELEAAKSDVGAIADVFGHTSCGAMFSGLSLRQRGMKRRHHPIVALQKAKREHRRRRRRRDSALASVRSASARSALASLIQELDGNTTTTQSMRGVVERPVERSSSNSTKSCANCRQKNNPNCEYLRDKVLRIQSETAEKRDRLVSSYSEMQRNCRQNAQDYGSEIQSLTSEGREGHVALAMATKHEIDMHSHWQARQFELTKLLQERDAEVHQCNRNIAEFQEEICSYQQIRGELAKMSGTSSFYQDCEVSEWAPGECSVSCGPTRGSRNLTRTVVSPPVRGAGCPPLTMVQACGGDPCPVDCAMTDWSEWSRCSADCGGGIKERARSITQRPIGGGQPCQMPTEAQECNSQACNKDCVLGRWSDWSPCSQSCGAGSQRMVRNIDTEAVGTGTCPEASSDARQLYRTCNEDPCPTEAPTQPLATCNSKVDVVILVDGSSAVGSMGWSHMKEAVAMLVEALSGDGGDEVLPRVALQIFGGQLTTDSCTPNPRMARTERVELSDCGISWLSHLSDTPSDGLKGTMSGHAYPAGSAATYTALGAAEGELLYGRDDAPSVVVVVTAGAPLSMEATAQAAARLREKARLVWVPVLRSGIDPNAWEPLEEMKRWASPPLHQNLVAVEGFATLNTAAAVNRLIEDVCAMPRPPPPPPPPAPPPRPPPPRYPYPSRF